MGRVAGRSLRLSENHSKAKALAATLFLHLSLAAWLLSLKSGAPPLPVRISDFEWLPPLQSLPPPPPVQPVPDPAERVERPVMSLPVPEAITQAPVVYDWYGDARVIARVRGGTAQRRGFGAGPAESPGNLKSAPEGPPPLFERALPRVGTTVTTPEGETILWVSDYCYISLSSTSLTMQDFHAAGQGVRRCIIPLGGREPRGDLFDHLKDPPAGQSPARPQGQQ